MELAQSQISSKLTVLPPPSLGSAIVLVCVWFSLGFSIII